MAKFRKYLQFEITNVNFNKYKQIKPADIPLRMHLEFETTKCNN